MPELEEVGTDTDGSQIYRLTVTAHHTERHYDGDECMRAIEAHDLGPEFCLGNAIKYLWRHDSKDRAESNTRKAIWYLTRYTEGMLAGVYPRPTVGAVRLLADMAARTRDWLAYSLAATLNKFIEVSGRTDRVKADNKANRYIAKDLARSLENAADTLRVDLMPAMFRGYNSSDRELLRVLRALRGIAFYSDAACRSLALKVKLRNANPPISRIQAARALRFHVRALDGYDETLREELTPPEVALVVDRLSAIPEAVELLERVSVIRALFVAEGGLKRAGELLGMSKRVVEARVEYLGIEGLVKAFFDEPVIL
jgi:hypothetical protein